MTDVPTIKWLGASGAEYTYWIYPLGKTFTGPGNYIFAKETRPGYYAVIYVGETGDLSSRFNDHHRQECISKNGATHFHVHRGSDDGQVRRNEETDIRNQWNPPCNRQ